MHACSSCQKGRVATMKIAGKRVPVQNKCTIQGEHPVVTNQDLVSRNQIIQPARQDDQLTTPKARIQDNQIKTVTCDALDQIKAANLSVENMDLHI